MTSIPSSSARPILCRPLHVAHLPRRAYVLLMPARPQSLSQLTLAHLRLPIKLVQRCAAALADSARARSAPHTFRLWRTGNEQAIISLAREVTGVPPNIPCESLFWEQQGDELYVAVTFGSPVSRLVH